MFFRECNASRFTRWADGLITEAKLVDFAVESLSHASSKILSSTRLLVIQIVVAFLLRF